MFQALRSFSSRGDQSLLENALKAANEASCKIGKFFISHNENQVALICYVPEVCCVHGSNHKLC